MAKFVIKESELKKMIQQEVERAQKIKALKEEQSKISSLLREMEEMDEMDTMEEEAPVATATPGVNVADIEKGAALLTGLIGAEEVDALEKAVAKKDPKIASAIDKGEKKGAAVNEMQFDPSMYDLMSPDKVAAIVSVLVAAASMFGKIYAQKIIGKIKNEKAKSAVAKLFGEKIKK